MKSILFYLRVTNQLSPHPPPIINVFIFNHNYTITSTFHSKNMRYLKFLSQNLASLCVTGIRILVWRSWWWASGVNCLWESYCPRLTPIGPKINSQTPKPTNRYLNAWVAKIDSQRANINLEEPKPDYQRQKSRTPHPKTTPRGLKLTPRGPNWFPKGLRSTPGSK